VNKTKNDDKISLFLLTNQTLKMQIICTLFETPFKVFKQQCSALRNTANGKSLQIVNLTANCSAKGC